MNEILEWLSTYSPPIVLLILFGAAFIYIIKIVTEKTISNQFDRYKKYIELKLERRSNFEEKILLDRYLLIKELQTKIENVMTNINRLKHGTSVEGFLVNNDIVPLTEVFDSLAVNKYLLTDEFHNLFWQQSQIAIQIVNEQNSLKIKQLQEKYSDLLEKFYKAINNMFELEKIKWKI